MANCSFKKRKKRKICSGDLRSQVQIQTRSIKPPSLNEYEFNEEFETTSTVWALIETKSGLQVFDGVNTIETPSHNIYIRYIEGVTFENWLIFEDNKYTILDVEDLEERHEFYLLRCSKFGNKDVKTTFSR